MCNASFARGEQTVTKRLEKLGASLYFSHEAHNVSAADVVVVSSAINEENPEIVETYLKYKDEEFENGDGFTVYGVSLDKKKEAWQKAITKDSLVWETHVSDLKGWKNEFTTLKCQPIIHFSKLKLKDKLNLIG